MAREYIQKKFDREIEKSGVRIKDADQLKVMENVFDDQTLLALYKLVHKKRISLIGGSISTGKEANVFSGEDENGKPIAIKIYRIQSANFKAMGDYLAGDPRFSSVRKSKKEVIFAWTKKEYSNLTRAHDAGINCPETIYFDRNILLMEFCGEGDVPYPQLRQVKLSKEEAAEIYAAIIRDMKTLFNDANLVHADLSEFNILFDGEKHIIIDMGQAVTPDHPRAIKFLVRDIKNINRYFSRLCDIRDEEEIFKEIVGEHRMMP
ncbi:serine protein kinase RIO [Methanoplanus sp. FWC-SCC4]|uniref:non-specific serine/threonine protein kinase n=1 Tax=Methanochimaera problematica TaxID=2609417 RepID=A0AA97I587_9EURY|nr:serine protein kinase RIO [Methanoplanus sp. FWC-SCC4]WOF17191.1 serine protein kinase RIO [Methanoplanus sp. FWC-SCC4]